jgi:alcohol dehydrogenase
MIFDYHIPTKILFGVGKLNELSSVALPGKKALIVISSGTSMKKHGYLEKVVQLLKDNNTASVVFDKILSNPIKQHVMEGAALAKKENCDFIIGLGGGSSIDSAKSIAIMAKNEGDYWDYINGGSGKGKPVEGGVLPIVAITTTAGTGTEVDPWTVITHEGLNEKIGYGLMPETFPTLSIVDPELLISVPPVLTAYQGFDAFFHSAEGYIAKCATPISDIYALKCIELVCKNLPTAVKDGLNLEARTNLALANILAGFVESTSCCTSEHSMEHALSAFHPQLPHGAGLIMLSESYFTFFADKIPDRLTEMAKVMGQDVDSVSEADKPKLFIQALKQLQIDCDVHLLKMSDFGITLEEIPAMMKNARDTMGGLFDLDPYQLSDQEALTIMQDAYK